jgi:UDP-N-acetylglucosamine 2-epimerase (non-hydrolysing)
MCVVGARPNFMKVAPILRALQRANVPGVLVHTGQHHDELLSGVFFRDLDLPAPNVYLGVGSGSHAEQTARVMLAFDPALETEQPACVIVVGDVNSTVACALVAAKRGVPLAHVEAGLRSGDRTMPEELNRIVTDQLADLCLTPSRDADENLRREGILGARVACVGNVMIDALVAALPAARRRSAEVLAAHGVTEGAFALATLHRPSNVDDADALARSCETLAHVAHLLPVVFPAHPRTRARIEEHGLAARLEGVRVIDPVGYVDCLALEASAALVLTDSGGIQEETTFLGIPCLTLRENTERPITVLEGTNRVVGTDPIAVVDCAREALAAPRVRLRRPEMWDGAAARRIVARVVETFRLGWDVPGVLSVVDEAGTSSGAL